jgi:CubicO group peptidase (beta-lactamase class C family)
MSSQTRGSGVAPVRIELADGRLIRGFVDEGYGLVVETFRANFLERRDVGAACSVYVAGRLVVDLWGGLADRKTQRQWETETAAIIFSCSKGLLAICTYLLAQEGRLNLDAPIASYWPKFGQNGKQSITVRCALAHRAGLPALDVDLSRDDVIGWEPVVRAIESQPPLWVPDTTHSYHPITYGWLIGEIIRRVTGHTPGAYFRQALGDPLRLHTWIGLPAEARDSVAWMEPPLPDEDSPAARAAAMLAENRVAQRSMTMGGAFGFPTQDGVVSFNDPALQASEIPGANGISTARSLARLYAGCVSEIDGPRLLTVQSIDDAIVVRSLGQQRFGAPDDGARWGTGFQLSSPPYVPMLGARSFGHAGAGGQLAFGDDEYGVGFAYLSNQMGGFGDARARELTSALSRCIGGHARQW